MTMTMTMMTLSRNRKNVLLVIPFLVTTMLLTSSSVSSLQIGPLLSTCVDACQRGCEEIRSVQQRRKINDGEFNTAVELKDVNDPKSALTEADTAAQLSIVGALRAEWGSELRIVGEEDDDEDLAKQIREGTFEPLKRDMFDDDIGETAEIDIGDVTIFVDPLDGTREFVEGRLANCQTLVGIAIDGEAVAGAVGMPFPAGDLSTESTTVYGLVGLGTGVVGEPLRRGPFPLEQNIDGVTKPRPHHATSDNNSEVMEACRTAAIKRFGGSSIVYGGAGNKIFASAIGEVSCTIQHKVGGPWDLCAPEAILKALDGKMTDLFGEEIAIYRPDAPPRCNERGYVATPSTTVVDHDALVAALNAQPAVQKYRASLESATTTIAEEIA